MHDLLVIGAGPGGIAATAYANQMGLDVRVVAPDLGGKVNYPFSLRGTHYTDVVYGAELTRTLLEKVSPDQHLPTEAASIAPIEGGFRVSMANALPVEARTLVLAMGAKPRRLYVPGEMEMWGKGLSFSPVSHAHFFGERRVAIIGNDRRAQIAVVELARIADTVNFIVPQPRMLDDALMQRIHDRHNVSLFRGWEVISVDGNEEYLTGLTLQSSDGVVRPLRHLDGVFVTLGLIPNSDLVADLVKRDEEGRVIVDHQARTSNPAIFAAGDITNAYVEQVPIAIGDGIKAAISASAYLAVQ